MAAGFKPAPPAGQLGAVIVDPYGNAPLTALVDLDSHVISDVKVTVHGKGEKGVEISYPVGQESLKLTMVYRFLVFIRNLLTK